MLHPNGKRHVVGGVYRELQPPRLLSFTWKWEDNPTMPDTLRHDRARGRGPAALRWCSPAPKLTDEKLRADHRHGWTSCLERLGAVC